MACWTAMINARMLRRRPSQAPNMDTNADGTTDGKDQCANDMDKTAPDICRCGMSDATLDENGIASCFDNPGMT